MRTVGRSALLLVVLAACGEPDSLSVEPGDPNKDLIGSRPDRVPEPGECDVDPASAACTACREEAFESCAGARGECGLLSDGIANCAAANGCAQTGTGWDQACLEANCATSIGGLNRCLLYCSHTLRCGGAGAGVCDLDPESLPCAICVVSGEESCFNEICGRQYAAWRTCVLDNGCNEEFYPVVDRVCETAHCDPERQARDTCVLACEPVMQCPPPDGFLD